MQKQEKKKKEKGMEEVIPDSLIALRNEVMHNQVPTAYIIKNWIHEG